MQPARKLKLRDLKDTLHDLLEDTRLEAIGGLLAMNPVPQWRRALNLSLHQHS